MKVKAWKRARGAGRGCPSPPPHAFAPAVSPDLVGVKRVARERMRREGRHGEYLEPRWPGANASLESLAAWQDEKDEWRSLMVLREIAYGVPPPRGRRARPVSWRKEIRRLVKERAKYNPWAHRLDRPGRRADVIWAAEGVRWPIEDRWRG